VSERALLMAQQDHTADVEFWKAKYTEDIKSVQEYKQTVREKNHVISKLEAEQKQLEKEFSYFNDKLDNHNAEQLSTLEKHSAVLDKLNREIDTLQEVNESLKQSNETLAQSHKKQHQDLSLQNQNLSAKLTLLEGRYETDLEELKDAQARQEEELKARCALQLETLEARVEALTQERNAALESASQMENDSLSARLESEEKFSTFQNTIRKETEANHSALMEDFEARLKRIQLTRDEASAASAESTKQYNTLKIQAQMDRKQFDAYLESEQKKYDALQQKYEAMQGEISQVTSATAHQEHKYKTIQKTVESMNQQKLALMAAHDQQIQDVYAEHAQETKALEEALMEKEASLASVEQENQQLAIDNKQLLSEHDRRDESIQHALNSIKATLGQTMRTKKTAHKTGAFKAREERRTKRLQALHAAPDPAQQQQQQQ
jgi:chromosome segregation ATPase